MDGKEVEAIQTLLAPELRLFERGVRCRHGVRGPEVPAP